MTDDAPRVPSHFFSCFSRRVHNQPRVKSVSAARAALAAMAGSGSDGLAELTAEELADLPDFSPNIYKVVRALRKDDHGPYNCLASIVHDAAFVKGVVREYGLPTFANLRCGLWYAGRHHGGQAEEHGSTARGDEETHAADVESDEEQEEDLRVAIDGTCYFKSTDGHCNNWSFSGTRLNVHVAETAARCGGCVIVDATRSTTKRFPDSLSKTIPIWAETLNRAVREARRRGEEADEDAATKKNQTNAWDDDAAHSGAAFPPWIGERERDAIRELLPSFRERLRAVSPDLSRLVRTLQAPLRCVWVSRETAARGLPLLEPAGGISRGSFTPVVLVSASSPMQWHGERRVGRDGRSFAYVPGAGDDEESWARGLTADLFWRERRTLVAGGPGGCVERIDDVVRRARVGANAGVSISSISTRAEKRSGGTRLSVRKKDAARDDAHEQTVWRLAGSSDARRAAGGCLSGAGRAAAAAALGAALGAVEDGAVRVLFSDDDERHDDERHDDDDDDDDAAFVSLRGVALGSAAALSRPETWRRARAILFVGDAELPACVVEGVASRTPPYADTPFLRVPARLFKTARAELAAALPAALAFLEKHARAPRRAVPAFDRTRDAATSSIDGTRVDATDDAPTNSKDYVLIACNDGADHCVGVAVARAVAAELAPRRSRTTGKERDAPPVTKDSVRRRLAAVAARHPEASPTRGTLKQVFNYLLDASKRGRDRGETDGG